MSENGADFWKAKYVGQLAETEAVIQTLGPALNINVAVREFDIVEDDDGAELEDDHLASKLAEQAVSTIGLLRAQIDEYRRLLAGLVDQAHVSAESAKAILAKIEAVVAGATVVLQPPPGRLGLTSEGRIVRHHDEPQADQ